MRLFFYTLKNSGELKLTFQLEMTTSISIQL